MLPSVLCDFNRGILVRISTLRDFPVSFIVMGKLDYFTKNVAAGLPLTPVCSRSVQRLLFFFYAEILPVLRSAVCSYV